MAKKFRARVSADFEIVDGSKSVGWIRVKPSDVLWGSRKHSWYRLKISQFARLARRHGTIVKR
jgi:hypothetical protein